MIRPIHRAARNMRSVRCFLCSMVSSRHGGLTNQIFVFEIRFSRYPRHEVFLGFLFVDVQKFVAHFFSPWHQEGFSPQILAQYYRTHIHLAKSHQRGGGGGGAAAGQDDSEGAANGGASGKFFGGGAKAAMTKTGVRTLSWW